MGGPGRYARKSTPDQPTAGEPIEIGSARERASSVVCVPDPAVPSTPGVGETQTRFEGKVETARGLAGAVDMIPELDHCLARVAPEQAALVEALVGPLINHFNLLQRHLVEQFHQAGMLLFETFSTLHEENRAAYARNSVTCDASHENWTRCESTS